VTECVYPDICTFNWIKRNAKNNLNFDENSPFQEGMLVKARPMKKLCEYEGKGLPQVNIPYSEKISKASNSRTTNDSGMIITKLLP
jgi:hypothetical protein